MPVISPRLISEIYRLAAHLPQELVERVAAALQSADDSDLRRLRLHLADAVPHPAARDRVSALIDAWMAFAPQASAESVAMALLTAAYAEADRRHQQTIELVWTGPDSQIIPLRRTDQALLQLIDESHRKLTIVSFAVYRVQAVSHALVRAAQRRVEMVICLETPDAGEGKVAFDTVKALGEDVRECARLYAWPLDKRSQTPDGRHGSLHAKVAVADGRVMLISSANLTEYAMTLNMELGVLIHGGDLPAQVEAHFAKLIESNMLRQIETFT